MKHRKKHIAFACACACALALLMGACGFDGHTSDSKLERNFFLNEAGFEALVAQVNTDTKLEMLKPDLVSYDHRTFSGQDDFSGLEHLGLSTAYRMRYNQQIRALDVSQITKGEGGVEFRVDTGSFWNGDSYKGYYYSRTPPEGHRKASLDRYQVLEEDKDRFGNCYVYKPIKGNWYLYLFINR